MHRLQLCTVIYFISNFLSFTIIPSILEGDAADLIIEPRFLGSDIFSSAKKFMFSLFKISKSDLSELLSNSKTSPKVTLMIDLVLPQRLSSSFTLKTP